MSIPAGYSKKGLQQMANTKRYIKRVGPKGVTLWTWTPELAKRSDCFEISEREALHIIDPKNNPAPPNITNLQHLDDNLVTMLGSLTEDQQRQLMVLMGQVQHGQVAENISQPVKHATALNMGVSKNNDDDTIGHTNEMYDQNVKLDGNLAELSGNTKEEEPPVDKNGRPSKTSLARMTKLQLQEHSALHFPDKPEFDIEDPNNTNDFMREKINEWWDELERG